MNHIERLNELYKEIEARLGGDLNWLKDDRTALIALAELIESWLALFDELEAELKERYAALAAELTAKKDELQTALETRHGELETQLVTKHGELENALTAKKDELQTALETRHGELETQLVTKHGELENALTAKKDELQTALETRKGELETELVTKKDELQNALNVSNEEFKTTQTAAYEAFKGEVTQKQTAHEAVVTNALNTQKQEWQASQTQQDSAFDAKIQTAKTEFEASQEAQTAEFDKKLNNTTNALMVQINKYEHLPEAWANQLTAINKIQAKDKEQDGKIAALETAKTEQQNINNGLATQLLNLDTKFVKKGDTEAEFNPYFKFQCGLWKFWKFGAGVPEDDMRRMIYFNQDRAGFEDKMALLIGGAALGFKEYGGQRLPATGPENSHGKDWKLLDERDLRDDSVLGKEERGVKVKELNNGFLKTIKLGNTTLDEVTLKHIIEVCNNIDGNLVPQDQ